MSSDVRSGAIDLARIDQLEVGPLVISPSTLQVAMGGERWTLEPRIMQVLTALVGARGAVLRRDDLIDLCWSGRTVGDNAIHRAISRLRDLLNEATEGGVTIETIPRVGYRLAVLPAAGSAAGLAPSVTEPGTPAVADNPPDTPPPGSRRRVLAGLRAWMVLVGLVMVAAILVAGALAFRRPAAAEAALDQTSKDFATRGRAAVFEGTPEQLSQAIGYFRMAIDHEPKRAGARGALAMAMIMNQPNLPPEAQRARAEEIRGVAAQAISLNPGDSHALAARVFLEPAFGRWANKQDEIQDALTRSDRDGPAPIRANVEFLLGVGRTREALDQARRLDRINPVVPFIKADLIAALMANGDFDEATGVAAQAGRIWPNSFELWRKRFELAVHTGDLSLARSLVDDRRSWPEDMREADMARLRRFVDAYASGDPRAAEAVLAAFDKAAADGVGYAEMGVWAAAALRRPDWAFRFADRLYDAGADSTRFQFKTRRIFVVNGDRDTSVWFGPFSDRLWGDPRFMARMDRIGLVDYWRRRGPPDACHRPEMLQACVTNGILR